MEKTLTSEEALCRIRAVAAILLKYSYSQDMENADSEAMDLLASELLEAADTLERDGRLV